ncbi:MAG: hypothetical protein AAF438_23220 [Pseudomonadota bacterium]
MAEYVAMLVSIPFVIGVFGYVWSKPILSREFWTYTIIVNIAYSILFYFVTNMDIDQGMSTGEFLVGQFISWLLGIPAYIALYLYQRKSNELWADA